MTLPTIPCPECGIPNDGQYSPEHPEAVPSDGDLSVCLYCGHLAVFTGEGDTLGLRPMTEEEHEQAMNQAEVSQAVAFVKRMRG